MNDDARDGDAAEAGANASGFGVIESTARGFSHERPRDWIRWPMPVAIREMSRLMQKGKCLADAREIIRTRQSEPPPEA